MCDGAAQQAPQQHCHNGDVTTDFLSDVIPSKTKGGAADFDLIFVCLMNVSLMSWEKVILSIQPRGGLLQPVPRVMEPSSRL